VNCFLLREQAMGIDPAYPLLGILVLVIIWVLTPFSIGSLFVGILDLLKPLQQDVVLGVAGVFLVFFIMMFAATGLSSCVEVAPIVNGTFP
jgi:hypothetical protein